MCVCVRVYMYMCIYIYTCVCVYVCKWRTGYLCHSMPVCLQIWLFVRLYSCVKAGRCARMHTGYIYVCMYGRMDVCMYACMQVRIYACMCMPACRGVYVYGCLYTCMYACVLVCMCARMHVFMYYIVLFIHVSMDVWMYASLLACEQMWNCTCTCAYQTSTVVFGVPAGFWLRTEGETHRLPGAFCEGHAAAARQCCALLTRLPLVDDDHVYTRQNTP